MGAMTSNLPRRLVLVLGLIAPLAVAPLASFGEEIAIAQYGSSTSAMPWAIALEKGFFKEAGVDITAIRASAGGSADLRSMIAGDLPYAESALAAVVTAAQKGAEVKIVSENVHTVANFVWATMPNSPIKTLSDIKGKRLTFTTPQSTSEVMEHLLIEKVGLKQDDVKLVATGPYGAALTAIQNGGADIALLAEPIFTLNPGKYRALAWARDVFPPLLSTVGVTSAKIIKERPQAVRAILVAHRRAVEFITTNRKEAAAIVAKIYKLDPLVIEAVLGELIDHPSVGNVPYFGRGDFLPEGIDNLTKGLTLIGALDADVQWRSLVDQSFLPTDLQRPL
jgi:NitT/TauT family transport system substrate-binding protein